MAAAGAVVAAALKAVRSARARVAALAILTMSPRR